MTAPDAAPDAVPESTTPDGGSDTARGDASAWTVLRTRHVPRLLSASLIGRLPTGMVPLALVLAVRHHGGDYRLVGVLTALYAAGAAVGGPAMGRLIDRTRQPPVLLSGAMASGTALVALMLLDPVRSPVLAALAAVVAGAATPQLEPCLRVLWEHVLHGERAVRAAFALDAATQELVFVCGPLLVFGATTLLGPPGGLLTAAVIGLAGTAVFATASPARRWRAARSGSGGRQWAGPLRSGRLVRLFAALVCVGATIGAFTVAMTGYADAEGSLGAASWLVALNAVGALLGGVLYAAVPVARREDRRLLLLLGMLAVGYLPLVLTPAVPGMAPLSLASGFALPAVLASAFALVARLAPAGTLTEAHAWMITSFGAGNAGGSALAGTLVDLASPAVAFAAAALCATAAVALSPGGAADDVPVRTS
ncbi:putative major facilitator superfamily transporter [Streptomyces sp. NBRC 110611]|uniref:MFS transporter n=1 Tax=Streptomyces sp. NBRC 110611 TaxID=1621259 RepID=UPI0008581079|nr:MFS transporter [Streptomyces sp. NBRC 110611]GAU69184.1 putative major facilitator superfamily transporter [Streptomyces sp. NBRC 110611]